MIVFKLMIKRAIHGITSRSIGYIKNQKSNLPDYLSTNAENGYEILCHKKNIEFLKGILLNVEKILRNNNIASIKREEWDSLLKEYQKKNSGTSSMTLDELINAPLKRSNISSPMAKIEKGNPLLTTDYYYISSPEGNNDYSILEMDDTVVGYAAQKKNIDFLFVRNVSDTVVVGEAGGQQLTKSQREGWSSVIYEKCGLYTSVNGALTTWSAITG